MYTRYYQKCGLNSSQWLFFPPPNLVSIGTEDSHANNHGDVPMSLLPRKRV